MMSKAGLCQLVCIILLAAFIGFSFFGEENTVKTADEIAAEVTEGMNLDGLERFDSERLLSQLGVSGENFESFVYYGSEDIMDVREILVIKAGEDCDTDSVTSLLVKKAEEKYNTYKDYDPVASALLEKRVIQVSKGAIIYMVHDDASVGLDAFLRCVEE
ncbi:MAG: DUF4358 domain-containing protein [Ruminococcaceae bacterium]|nr:DUF4358 domain-containing protein [Oscillospiraceae bacterium]